MIKCLTPSFYKSRKYRKKARIKYKESVEMGYFLWNQTKLSSSEDYARTLFCGINFVDQNHTPPIHFTFLTKCGCTSLKQLFLNLHYENNQPKALFKTKPDHRIMSFYMPDFDYKALYQHHDKFYSAAFVRNPYARLASCFRNRVSACDHKGNKQIREEMHSLPSNTKNSFEAFIKHICQLKHHEKDQHFSSQWFYLSLGHKYAFIGFFEQFSEHAHRLFSFLNASEEILESITTKHNNTGQYDWKSYYNQEIADLVYETYFPDFEAFGYDKNSWKEDFIEEKREPIAYDPSQDIERFRPYFETVESDI